MPGYHGISFLEQIKTCYYLSKILNGQRTTETGHTHVILSTPEAERALQLQLPIKQMGSKWLHAQYALPAFRPASVPKCMLFLKTLRLFQL
jgi:hypothetical protein